MASLAVMTTLLVWWRESDAVSSPGVTAGVLLVMAAALAVMMWLGRPTPEDEDARRTRPTQGDEHRRPRAFSEVPAEQRRRLLLMTGSIALLFLLLVPLLILVTMRDGSLWEAAPIVVVLALALLALVFGWRQARRPSARTLAVERQSHEPKMSRRSLAFLAFLPAFFLAGLVYRALESSPPLAVAAAAVVNIVGAVLVLVLDARLARSGQGSEGPEPTHRPVW